MRINGKPDLCWPGSLKFQQIQQLFCCTHTAEEDNDTVSDTYKRFQTFSISGMMINSLTSGLGGSAAIIDGSCHTNKATVFVTLLRVSDRSTFHRRFHRSRTQPVQIFSSRRPSWFPTRRAYKYSFSLIGDRPSRPPYLALHRHAARERYARWKRPKLVMWTELSRFRLENERCYEFAHKRRECHAEPRTSWPAKRRIIRPSTKASSGDLSVPALRRVHVAGR